jgi:hypothetical protein
MASRASRFLALGAASGAVAAAATFIPLGDTAAPVVFGRCLGLKMMSSCNGVALAVYLFPGLIFGVLFAEALRRRGQMIPRRAVVFVLASGIGNALAVFVCVALFDWASSRIDAAELAMAISGAVAGGVGGGLLTAVTGRLFPSVSVGLPIAAAAGLGVVVVAVTELEQAGVFVFYIIWQAGYAAALAASLPAEA